ncbi:2882_t:CDS:2 [Paraglomus brasilianum]|uniref:Xylulose kinase n=1 Tax=Paraglomus brasilianum TaxID=144538 RepID=A0A9N9AYJ8_9GLOM|nr:2882_t:CDS:2 [Paraglomus brasilianum]
MADTLYVGFDLSTQQLKLTVINDTADVVCEETVRFTKELPQYGTSNGVIINGHTVTSPTLMWVESLDLLLSKLSAKAFPFHSIRVISGAAQQHGSVFWKRSASQLLRHLNPQETLKSQLRDAFALEQSPTWQDSSTSEYCQKLEEIIGGAQELANITGSRAYERFTGNQIAKIYQNDLPTYNNTERISVVSSFLASLFLGDYAPIDASDASGMNLFNIHSKTWDERLLIACGGEALREKLGNVEVFGLNVMGNVCRYFVERYGFSPDCKVLPFMGDNPSTLLSRKLCPSDVLISLGTSDTLLLVTTYPITTTESHTLCHPISNQYISMLCYKNGSLTREHIRDTYTSTASWDSFNTILRTLVSKPDETKFGFYFQVQEIIPFAYGIYRFDNGELVDEFRDPNYNIRAILESQFLSMKARSARLLHGQRIERLLVVGGASANDSILQVLADVFGVKVFSPRDGTANSASFGAAMKARMMACGEDRDEKSEYKLVASPNKENNKVYDRMLSTFVKLEERVVMAQGPE